jgi:hypothetical protein
VKRAVLQHMRQNGVRFLKFDGGNYACDDPGHGHLPGRYAVEHMHELLIELSRAAREQDPDVFIMWYWGLRSPFWALHGDTIFESGLFMEGSGTSSTPCLSYRDSVTLAQDQNATHARTIPPVAKDSLGVWLADTRWGNYMGRERWREALVMDLGRGNLLFPNLWGDVYLLDDGDVRFLAEMQELARKHEELLLRPRQDIGDPMRGDVYGYAYGDGHRGLLFLNNPCFGARRVDVPLGVGIGFVAGSGSRVRVESRFPEREVVVQANGESFRSGQNLELWLRPFEALLLELRSPDRGRALPRRSMSEQSARGLGVALDLRPSGPGVGLDVTFADAGRLAAQGHAQSVQYFESELSDLGDGPPPVLAIALRLRRGAEEWKHVPYAADIAQAVARAAGERISLVPVPDARQFGNTQKAGCSWVVYKTRLPRRWSRAPLGVAAHLYAPPGVRAEVEAWVVRRWWTQAGRPSADGYYADAPS